MSESERQESAPINWPTVLFLSTTTLGALAWPLYAYQYGVTIGESVLALIYFAATGMAITVGYHRLVSHRTFKCSAWVEALLLFVGAAAWQGSALDWGADHVRHHAYIDTDRDPYNIRRGFWYAHVGWLLRVEDRPDEDPPAFLTDNRMVMFQHRYYVPIAVFAGFILPLMICGVGGLLLAGVVRTVAVHHSTWFINSWAHVGSFRPYRTSISAVDNWFLAFFTFGEGYHNYHHSFPSDYRNGITWASWDPSKWLIWSLSKTGAAWDLKRTSPSTIWRRRVEAALAYEGNEAARERLIRTARASLETLVRRTELRLSKVAARMPDVHISAVALDKAEIQARLAARVESWKVARDGRRLRRAQRLSDLLDLLSMYREMLDQLVAGYAPATA